MKHLPQALLCSLLACVGFITPATSRAATPADLDATLAQLKQVVPSMQLEVQLQRTLSRAIVYEEEGRAVLTLDPGFMQQLSPLGLTFVVAHEYSHIYLKHQDKLSALAMQLSGQSEADAAFDALEYKPVLMNNLHALNRQHELAADKVATDWLAAMGLKACHEDVLSSIDNGGLVFTVVPSHPGFHERKRVICPDMGKPKPFDLLIQQTER